MLLNHLRTPVWSWDGKAESLCPCCRTPLIAKRPHDKVWHWAHKQHSNQNEGTCLFEESAWALRWRLGYYKFPGWEIEVAKKAGDRVHVIMAMRPPAVRRSEPGGSPVVVKMGEVREFVGKISDKHEARFQFLMGTKNHNVAWMFNGEEWASDRRRAVGNKGGMSDMLKPKAQALYERIRAAGQHVMLHLDGKLWREWSPQAEPTKRTGIWFQLTGEAAQAVLRNFSEVTLPYENTPAPAPAARPNPLATIQV